MNVLETIVAHKLKEVATRLKAVPLSELEKRTLFQQPVISMKKHLSGNQATGIIAEFKRKSPSKGVIHAMALPDVTALQYVGAGASALSVLTDTEFFGGSDADFLAARKVNLNTPMLRKDFVINEYQIVEAKSLGADAVLLIAACLDPVQVQAFTRLAHSLDLEVLLEVHNEEELLLNLSSEADMIGVNNRDLKTFEVTIDVSKRLFPLLPKNVIKVSESGIDTIAAINELKKIGFQGFLIGQKFMETKNPGLACADFIHELRTAK